MKKLLALLLSLCMVFTSVGIVSAAEYTDVSVDNTYSEAIKVLSDLNILNGFEDNSFKPNDIVTRAQMAKILCAALGYQNIGAAAGKFADVPAGHWAAGYIETISSLGIVNGYGNDMFGPEDPVTYEQAITMVVRTLGYEPAVGNANYPTGYLTKAGDLGLTKNIVGNFSTPMMRKHVAQLVFNALDVPLMTQSGYGTFTQYIINDGYSSSMGTVNVKKTILSENHNIVKVQGTIESSSDSVSTNKNAKDYVNVNVNVINAYNNKYGTSINGKMFAGDSDAMSYVGKKVVLFVQYDEFNDEKTVVSLYEVAATDTLTIDIADIIGIDLDAGEIKYYINDSKTTTVSLSENTAEYYNGYLNRRNVTIDELLEMSGTIELSLLDNETADGDYDTMYITAYDVFVVDEVNATSKRVSSKVGTSFGTRISYNEEDGDVKVSLVDENGATMNWVNLAEYDVLAVKYVNTGAKEIYIANVISNTVTGTVTGTSGIVGDDDRYVEIDGIEYKVLVIAEDNDNEIKLGDEGIYYLDGSDNIVYHSATIIRNNNYAYVIGVQEATDMDNAKVKVLTKENGIVTVEVATKISVTVEGEKTTNVSTKSDEFKAQAADAIGTIVAYKLNAAGQVNAIEIASENTDEDYLSLNATDADMEDYDVDGASFKVNGKKYYLTNNTVIFYVPETIDEDDYEVVALKNLSDDQDLFGADIYDVDDDRNIGVIVLKGENSINPSSENAAFVTKVSATVDEDGYDIYRVTAYVGLEEVSYICEDADEDAILGKLVIPTYKANGDVKDFEVVGADFNTNDEDVEVAYGTLEVYNDGDKDISPINTKKKFIVLNGDDTQEYKVPSSANIYVYNETANSRNKSKIGESLGYVEIDAEEDVIYIDGEEVDVTVDVFLYIYDGDVVDVLYYIY